VERSLRKKITEKEKKEKKGRMEMEE